MSDTLAIPVSGQIAELPRAASGADLIAWARTRTFPGVRAERLQLIFRRRFLLAGEPLHALGLQPGESLSVVESTCMHTSPYDPERGVYLCGWC